MKNVFRSLILLLAISCQPTKPPASLTQEISDPARDSLIYEQLQSKFDLEFQQIEKEFELASDARKLELEALYEQTELDLVEAQKDFIKSHPKSAYCLPILREIDWSFDSAAEFKSYLKLIKDSDYDPDDYARLAAFVEQMGNVEVGQIAPDFEMEDEAGKLVKLSDMYTQSAYLLLDFWASTCGPCRIENKHIRKAYDQFHSRGFDVLGVSTDARKESWMEAIDMDGLIWTNLCSLQNWNENEIVKIYALRQVSQNFLLDSRGKILATNLRGDALQSTLEKLMN